MRGAKGENLGTMTWSSNIEQAKSIQESERIADTRNEPRLSLVLKVRYSTNGGKSLESTAGGIGGEGLFIESTAPLPVGTDLAIEFALPDSPSEWMHAKGTVAWVCPSRINIHFRPGWAFGLSTLPRSPAVACFSSSIQ